MAKPINVEAQRIAKIVDETQCKFYPYFKQKLERLEVLAILSHELFVEVKKRSEDDLSK